MQMRVLLMLALRRSRSLSFFLARAPRGLGRSGVAPMAHFSAYSLQDYSATPAYFPRCFVEELAQRPRAARLEEMTRFMERLGLPAPSEQTFGVMAATLLAVRGDDAPFESGRAYELFLHVTCFWRKGAPARPKPTQWVQRLPEDLHAFQRDYGATFADVFDKTQAADITDADFAAEVRSVTALVPMRRTNSALALGGGQAGPPAAAAGGCGSHAAASAAWAAGDAAGAAGGRNASAEKARHFERAHGSSA